MAVRPAAGDRAGLFASTSAIGQTAVLGAFVAQDLALFVLFFDLMLVPFYFIVGQWGAGDRAAAAMKMVIYTLVGSLLMLAAAVATAVLSNPGGGLSFVLTDLQANPLPESTQKWLFIAFALAFLIKMPAFPFHGWMPDAYRSMPLPALAFFSGVRVQGRGLRLPELVLPLFPAATNDWNVVLLVLAADLDPLRLDPGLHADERAAHPRLLVDRAARVHHARHLRHRLGRPGRPGRAAAGGQPRPGGRAAVLRRRAARRAREGSEDIRDYGGIAFRAPVLAVLFLIVALATLAMPGSANFAGEFLILLGAFSSVQFLAFVASLGVILASVYALRMYIRAMHNRVGPKVTSFEMTRARRFGARASRARDPRVRAVPPARARRG